MQRQQGLCRGGLRRAGAAAVAEALGAAFLHKKSPDLLEGIRRFILEHFGFGDFVFRMPDGTEVDRAGDLPALIEKMRTVPAASFEFHSSRNDFSRWLRARAEFGLAGVMELVTHVASLGSPVLLLGETGVGKEVAARALHRLSGRSGQFVAINVAALQATLVEAELFGTAPGQDHRQAIA